jgi:hypothetical protein
VNDNQCGVELNAASSYSRRPVRDSSSFKRLASSFQLARRGGNSNRHPYEKLEFVLSPVQSMKRCLLIDTEMHFFQGTLSVSRAFLRDAQFASRAK